MASWSVLSPGRASVPGCLTCKCALFADKAFSNGVMLLMLQHPTFSLPLPFSTLLHRRHLSLGPPPPYWSSALNLHQRTLATVRTLHIAGCMLYRSEAMAIGGFFKSALPRLREFEWTVWIEHVVEHPINIVEALSYLLGAEGRHATTGRSGSATVSTTARTNAPPASASRSMAYVQRRKPLRRVAASINPYDVTLWQRSASPALRDDPRLVLQACEPTVESNLCAVRSWWERKAGV